MITGNTNEPDSYPFIKIGGSYYPANAIHFETLPYSETVTIYKLGTYEMIAHVSGSQAKMLITNLNRLSLSLLPDR